MKIGIIISPLRLIESVEKESVRYVACYILKSYGRQLKSKGKQRKKRTGRMYHSGRLMEP